MPVKPSIYNIYLSNGDLLTTINPGEVNNTAFTLPLPGNGRLDYGNFMDNNIVHMVEHFADDVGNEPVRPLVGQIFYGTDTQTLYVCTDNSVLGSEVWDPLASQQFVDDNYVNVTGDTMTGNLTMSGGAKVTGLPNPTVSTDAVPFGYADARYVNVTGDSMSGHLNMTAGATVTGLPNPSVSTDAVPFGYADARYVNVTGDTMTGFLTLNANPTSNLHAATKQYVDTADALKVSKTGDTMTGNLTMSSGATVTGLPNPINATDAVPFSYADGRYVNVTGDTMTGNLTIQNNAPLIQYVDTSEAASAGRYMTVSDGSFFDVRKDTAGNGTYGQVCLRLTGVVQVGQPAATVYGQQLILSGNDPTTGGLSGAQLIVTDGGSRWKQLRFHTNGITRWVVGSDPTPETGGDVGSNFIIHHGTDGGTPVGDLTIHRDTHEWYFGDVIQGIYPLLRHVANPIDAQDVATKAYVDSVAGGSGTIAAAVRFNGSTGVMQYSNNISSVTYLGTGQYRINFASPIGNFAVAATAGNAGGNAISCNYENENANFVDIRTRYRTGGSGTSSVNPHTVSVTITT